MAGTASGERQRTAAALAAGVLGSGESNGGLPLVAAQFGDQRNQPGIDPRTSRSASFPM